MICAFSFNKNHTKNKQQAQGLPKFGEICRKKRQIIYNLAHLIFVDKHTHTRIVQPVSFSID